MVDLFRLIVTTGVKIRSNLPDLRIRSNFVIVTTGVKISNLPDLRIKSNVIVSRQMLE